MKKRLLFIYYIMNPTTGLSNADKFLRISKSMLINLKRISFKNAI